MPNEQAARQGDIARLAFQILGRDQAITFLNTDNPLLGGRPITLATESREGQLHVEAELGRLRERQTKIDESKSAGELAGDDDEQRYYERLGKLVGRKPGDAALMDDQFGRPPRKLPRK